MRTTYVFISVVCIGLTACKLPETGFFTANTYLTPYYTQLDEPITVVLGEDIPDQFVLNSNTMRGMPVKQFRKSLGLSLYYTFESSSPEVKLSDQVADNGITIHLYRVRPEWEAVNMTELNTVEAGVLVRYDGVVYRNGERWLILDNTVKSEISTFFYRREGDEVFRDGIRELCEDIYQQVTQSAPKNS